MAQSRPTQLQTDQFDMDSFIDFSQGTTNPSPGTASSTTSPFDQEANQFNGPSHDYGQFKQQVGLPVGTLSNMPMNGNGVFDDFNSGMGDMGFDSGFGFNNSGFDLEMDMGMEFSGGNMPQVVVVQEDSDNYVNPSSVGGHEEPPSSVGRLWPGIHSQQAQQAAMQKATQAQAVQQRQNRLQAQQAQYRQVANAPQSSQGSSKGSGKRGSNSHVTDTHVEESISRLLNQMRHNTSAPDDDAASPSSALPHIARMKKDEEDMDEDERLLASDEGKKLSSKERRQLRNKVSARAFRSRRKEYISQLEGEISMKTQESNGLRQENQALMQENERFRALIETMLRHPSFKPFLEQMQPDASSLPPAPAPTRQQHQQSVTPKPQLSHAHPPPPPQPQQDVKPEYMNFDASQLQLPQQQPQSDQHQVGLAMIPEQDMSKLNIGGFNSMNYNFSQVNAFAVTDLPGPDPVSLLIESPVCLPRSVSAASTLLAGASVGLLTSCSAAPDLTVLLAKLDDAARRLNHTNIAAA